MTQEFVTLPREVAEQALKALQYVRGQLGSTVSEFNAIEAIRAALEQPQAKQPAMTPIAQRKLDTLLAEGHTISGYSVYHERKHQHGFVTGAGLVGWWKPEGMEYPQPRGEQLKGCHKIEKPCRVGEWNFGVGNLCRRVIEEAQRQYNRPQPKREPLTDEQIDAIADAMPGGLEGFLRGWGWRQFARAVLEATNNIK